MKTMLHKPSCSGITITRHHTKGKQMVIADYYIISINQKTPSVYSDNTVEVETYKVPLRNYNALSSEMFFLKILNGICYNFYPIARHEDYEHEWFDYHDNGNVLVLDTDKDKVLKILQTYIHSSPADCIGVFFRLQGYTKRTVKGIYSQKRFESMLLRGQVKFNALYLVSKTGLYDRDEYWKSDELSW